MMGDLQHRRFLACQECGTLIPADPSAADLPDDVAIEAVATIEEFVAAHGTHTLCELRRTAADSLLDRPFWDPMATVHIELTDGERTYVAKAHRRSVEDPRQFDLEPFSMGAVETKVDVDDDHVRRGLDLKFFPHAIRPTKIEDFLDVLHSALRDVCTDELEIAFVDADDPAVCIARMPEPIFQQLLAASARIFDPWEVPLVEGFLRENREEDGALALRVRRLAELVSD
jgi:hypothetical protein